MRVVAVPGVARDFQALAQLSHVQVLRRYREHRRPLNYLQINSDIEYSDPDMLL